MVLYYSTVVFLNTSFFFDYTCLIFFSSAILWGQVIAFTLEATFIAYYRLVRHENNPSSITWLIYEVAALLQLVLFAHTRFVTNYLLLHQEVKQVIVAFCP